MKKVLALLAVMAIFASASFAQFKNASFGLQGQIYAVNNSGFNFPLGGNAGATTYFNVGTLGFDVANNVKAALGIFIGGASGDAQLLGFTANQYLNLLRVVEANITLSQLGIDGLSAKIGRQYYGDANSPMIFIGARSFHQFGQYDVTSIDALTLNYKKDNVAVKAIYGDLSNAPGDQIYGVEGKLSKIADLVDVTAYIYDAKVGPTFLLLGLGVAPKNMLYAGIKPEVKIAGLSAAVEFIAQMGYVDGIFGSQDRANSTNLIKVDVAYDLKDVAGIALTPRATYFAAGGLDTKAPLGRTFTSMGNYMPGLLVGGTFFDRGFVQYINTRVINLGADYKYDQYVFSADYFLFAARNHFNVFSGNSSGELDLKAVYNYTSNIQIFAAYGMGMPDLANRQAGMKFGTVSTAQAGVKYSF